MLGRMPHTLQSTGTCDRYCKDFSRCVQLSALNKHLKLLGSISNLFAYNAKRSTLMLSSHKTFISYLQGRFLNVMHSTHCLVKNYSTCILQTILPTGSTANFPVVANILGQIIRYPIYLPITVGFFNELLSSSFSHFKSFLKSSNLVLQPKLGSAAHVASPSASPNPAYKRP